MKKIKYFVFTVVLLFMSVCIVSANSLYSIDYKMELDVEGNAHITEIWKMNSSKDTEYYKKEYNLGNMNISNFRVKDLKKEYTAINNWDIDASFEEKKYKSGINYVDEGLELCWGISEYGKNTYTLEYDINNVIFNTEDAQVLYMEIISGMDMMSDMNYTITISGPDAYLDSLDVWGYGAKGYAYVKDGVISLSNEENSLLNDEDDYVVALVKYPLGTFSNDSTNVRSEYKTFDDVFNKAQAGTYDYDYGEDDSNFSGDKLETIVDFVYYFIAVAFAFLSYKAIKAKFKYKFGEAGSKINMKEINAFRDIPCRKDIYRAYFISQAYGLNKNNTDFFGTVFLKWLNEDKIFINEEEKKKLFGGTKISTCIDLSRFGKSNIEVEQEIFDMIKDASGDAILDENEFKKYAKNHYDDVLKWFDKAEEYGRKQYEADNLVTLDKGKYLIDDKVKNDAIELAGLKKYLKEFASMDKKQPMEVKLWKEYLMFAQIFGMADEVAKQFEKLYPEIVEQMNKSNFDVSDIIIMNSFTRTAVVSASSARSAAQSYSSGGGGFSSGGGGGGSFGGGGGGSR